MSNIHPTAIIQEGAVIGADCVIGPNCHIGSEVVMGERNTLLSNIVIAGRTQIGDDNRFFPFAVIGTDPQDLKYNGEDTSLRIGNQNTIREFVTINRSNQLGEDTVVGNQNLLMAYVHVAHNCQVGSHCVIANSVQMAGHLVVDDYVTIGGLAGIHQFVHIGAYSFIGGLSAVKKDVPPYVRGEGNPFTSMGLNSVGLMRKGFSNESIAAIKKIYYLFFREGNNTSQALEALPSLGDLTPEQQIFVDFVRNADRGLCR